MGVVLPPGVAAVSEVSEPGVAVVAVVFVVDLEVAEPGVVVVAAVFVVSSAVDVAEPPASVDIARAFDVSVPLSVAAAGVDSPERPRFVAFPNVECHASFSSSVEVVGWEPVHSSTGVRANYGLCSSLSNPGLHQNKSVEHCYNMPNPGYNKASDTNDLPIDATTNHSRKTNLRLYRERRTLHSYQAPLSHPEAPQIRLVAAEKFLYLHLRLPSLG